MLENLNKQIQDCMKSQNKDRLSALRMLKSTLMENNTKVKPAPELDVIVAHAKKLQDSLALYPKDHTTYHQIECELKVVQEFLPQSLSEQEVVDLIKKIIASTQATQMGIVMKELSPQIKGRFDGKRASDLVSSLLKAT